MTDDQQQKLSVLLRLKRFEQPPPGYFHKLVQDVHRRQREEMLRRPLWQIAMDRFQTFFSEHSMGRLQYGGAMAAVLVTGLAIFGLSSPSRHNAPTTTLATAAPVPATVDLLTNDTTRPRLLSLDEAYDSSMKFASSSPDEPVANARLLPESPARQRVILRQPRYVIDSQPASYEPTMVSFSF